MDFIDIESNDYPYLLKQIKDPPAKLYFRGTWDADIFTETLSMVGARKMTFYGETITNMAAGEFAKAKITIVSGFMYGIDAQAHTAALEAGGRTIAVMPCGIEIVHPEYQIDLHKRIINERGLIISEYPGDTPPALWTYPRRNRIIAGLSPVLLVIEAGVKSGALITANIAKKYKREIFAVPGPLTSSVSRGTAQLIKDGASVYTDTSDILAVFGKKAGDCFSGRKNTDGYKGPGEKILAILNDEPLGIDALIRASGKSAAVTGAALTHLCLKKLIILKDGKYYLKGGNLNAN